MDHVGSDKAGVVLCMELYHNTFDVLYLIDRMISSEWHCHDKSRYEPMRTSVLGRIEDLSMTNLGMVEMTVQTEKLQ